MIIKTDAGRKLSSRGKQKSDCTVRAMAKAFRMMYDEAYELLKKHGREPNKGFRYDKAFRPNESINGYVPVVSRQFAWVGIRQVLRSLQTTKGTYILEIEKHVLCVIDGIVYDDHHDYIEKNKIVERAYKIKHIWED